MAIIYFEEKGEQLLKRVGMTKSEFARQMGIRRQNVKALFKSKNLETIYKASMVLGVPFELLVGYTSEPEVIPPPIPAEDSDDSFRDCPKDAFWYMIDHQEGVLHGVFYREETGDIDLAWGDNDCGVKHILLNQINHRGFPTVNTMIDTLTVVVSDGVLKYESPDKAVLEKDGYMAVIRKKHGIDGAKPRTGDWVLAGFLAIHHNNCSRWVPNM